MSHDLLTRNIRPSPLSPTALKDNRITLKNQSEIVQNSSAFHGTFTSFVQQPKINFDYTNPALKSLINTNTSDQASDYLQQKLHKIVTTNDWVNNPLPTLVTSLQEVPQNEDEANYFGFTIEKIGNKYHLSGRDITDKEVIRKQKLHDFTHDPLTGILNNNGLSAVINSLENNNRSDRPNGFTFAFLDLDGLKKYNDKLGHDAGDQYINKFAKLLTDTFRETDYIFRIKGNTGDEFGILITSNNIDFLKTKLEELRSTKTDYPFSFGVASRDRIGTDKINLRDLVYMADLLMYQDKKNKDKRKN